MTGRLLLLGLDAADVDLIQHWARNGELRTFSGIVAGSKMIRIVNEPGLYIGSVWPSISTGASVAFHGRYCWKQLRAGKYEDEFFQAEQIKGQAIWETLDQLGKSVCVIDIPKSLPGSRFGGRFVKDWGTHDPSTGGFRIYGWMKSEDFLRRYGRDEVGRCDDIERTAAGYRLFRDRLVDRAAARARILCDILVEGKQDIVMISFSEAHCAGHQCWHLHDPGHELFDRMLRDQLGNPVLDVYKALDEALRLVLEHVNEQDTVMLLATHGMGTQYNAVELLNSIVADFELEVLNADDKQWLQMAGIPRLLSYDSAEFRRRLRVFAVPNNGACAAFRLNVKGREPDGRLAPEDTERFLQRFSDHLMSLKNPDTGEKLFLSSVLSGATYAGPLAGNLPDLLLEWNRSSPIRRVVTPRSTFWNSAGDNPRTGDHRPNGGMWVIGPGAELFESTVESIRTSEVSEWMIRLSQGVRR